MACSSPVTISIIDAKYSLLSSLELAMALIVSSLFLLSALWILVFSSLPSIFYSISSFTLLIILCTEFIVSYWEFCGTGCAGCGFWATFAAYPKLRPFKLLSAARALLTIFLNLSRLPTRWIISLMCKTMYSSVTSYSMSPLSFCKTNGGPPGAYSRFFAMLSCSLNLLVALS